MVISPQYSGDGAYVGRPSGGGLDREWKLLQEAMDNRQISKNAEAQAKQKALDELSKLLDARAETITTNMNVRMAVMAESINQILDIIVGKDGISDQLKSIGTRFDDDELRLTQIEADLVTTGTEVPSDVVTGNTNARPSGRNYQQVIVRG